jgi:hypothetical protein
MPVKVNGDARKREIRAPALAHWISQGIGYSPG